MTCKKIEKNQGKELSPSWVTGFVDGDGCCSVGQRVCVVVSQNKRSIDALYKLQSFFGCGHVHKSGNEEDNMAEWRVENQSDLINKIFPHFAKYPLQTRKKYDLQTISDRVFEALNEKNPYNFTGPSELYKDIGWLAGLIDADGCFTYSMEQGKIQPQLVILQVKVEEDLFKKLKQHFLDTYGLNTSVYFYSTNYIKFQISRQPLLKRLIEELALVNNKTGLQTTKRWSMFLFSTALKLWGSYTGTYRRKNQKSQPEKAKVWADLAKIRPRLNKFNSEKQILKKLKAQAKKEE